MPPEAVPPAPAPPEAVVPEPPPAEPVTRERATVWFSAALAAGCLALMAWALISPRTLSWGTFSMLGVLLACGLLTAILSRRVRATQQLAVIATLAAVATAGRVLFAALPNFKPVTFVVFVAGAALGPGPGFMIGATTGLISNLFFGQGPWTPWQMLAWGLIGLAGAALGQRGRVPSRWTLALVGGILSVLFDWFVSLWMFLSFTDHSWPSLLALYARGLPFDAAHAAATALFCLLFGPATIRMLARYRARTTCRFLPLEAS